MDIYIYIHNIYQYFPIISLWTQRTSLVLLSAGPWFVTAGHGGRHRHPHAAGRALAAHGRDPAAGGDLHGHRSCGRPRQRPTLATREGWGEKRGSDPEEELRWLFFWGKVLEPSTFEVDDVTILWNSGDCASMWFSIERKSAGMATGCWGFWCTAMWVWVIGYPRGSHVVPTTGRP